MKINELLLSPYEVLDLTACAEEFPWNTGDSEIYLHLTVQRLILGYQSKLIVSGNVFILNCLEAVAGDLDGGQAIIVLSSSDVAQQRSFCRLPPLGELPIHGKDGLDGAPFQREYTPLGLRIQDGGKNCNGQNGSDGYEGYSGNTGRNGAMLFLADLRFGKMTGFGKHSILIKAGAGAGFPGTKGGDGGDGGNGGNGADGMATAFGIVRGYLGGLGGRGGDGGDGGRGGNGGQCCDLFVSVPSQRSCVFQTETFVSSGGAGGKGGNGGKGGVAGRYGKLQCDGAGQKKTLNGENGLKGLTGAEGKTRKAPTVNIYECSITKHTN